MGQEIKLIGQIISKKRRLVIISGQAITTEDNKLIADCEAKFMLS